MLRLFFALILTLGGIHGYCQLYSVAVGVYSGFTVPYTLDDGIDKDPRYKSRYTIKAAPIGFAFSMDYQTLGFQLSPGIYTVGQNYYVVNTAGGQDGVRNIDLKYISIPAAFKIHLIDLSFFRVSGVAFVSPSLLYDAKDQIRHNYTRLRFPSETYPIVEQLPGYSIEYNGVISPETNATLSEKKDYKPLQVFGGLGLCADWNVTEHWRVSFDFRVNYGFTESRSSDYLARIKRYESIYDTPGQRKEMFAALSVGVSRFLDFDKGDRDRAKGLKGNKRKFEPRKQVKSKPPRNRAKLK